MTKPIFAVCLTLFILSAGAGAQEHDFYKNLRYPSKLLPGVGRDTVVEEGGRRIVKWWPRKGQDIVEVPAGTPLRVWTRNKGQKDAEALAGVCRTWTASDAETFKAHLVGFRGFGTSTLMSDDPKSVLIPAAVLRLEDGSQRAILSYGPFSYMVSDADHTFIHKTWEKAYPKLHAKITQGDLPQMSKLPLKRLEEISPHFYGVKPTKNAKYPLWATAPDTIEIESPHFHTIAHPKAWGRPANWVNPANIPGQNRYRKHVLEYIENLWTYVEASGASMPYWRRPGENQKYQIHIWRARCAGGWGHCGIGDCNTVALAHEFFHGQALGGYPAAETICNAGQHTTHPGELQMFNGNFRYPWRNVNFMGYQSSLPFFVLGDNPNWGQAVQIVLGCLASPDDHTYYHTIARLGQKKGLWKNGVKGFGDFFGEYAARMVTCDFIEQHLIQSKYGMPEISYLHPVYGNKNRYRISNAEAPRWCGYNIIRLNPQQNAEEITVDFQGDDDPTLHSDWRACIVAVNAKGKARYSPLWNKGKMSFRIKSGDKKLWLTVAATPSAFPVKKPGVTERLDYVRMYLTGPSAPRYPWEVSLSGCTPGTPHRMQGDIENFDELYGRCDSGNTYLNYSVKHEVPITLDSVDGKLAQEKLAAMLPRIKASSDALEAKVQAGKLTKGYFWDKRHMRHAELTRRIKFLQNNAQGKRHANGGGFVSDNAKVAKTAYVGPGAMVLDGATVKENACVKDFAMVSGPKTVISGNAKISGRAWVCGDLKVTGNARIMEGVTVTTILRTPRTPSVLHQGQAEITGSAVIKGETYLFLCYAENQTITGGVVVDYEASVDNRQSGVFKHGRFYSHTDRRPPAFSSGQNAGAIYANYQFNQPQAVLLEDSYVNNNGALHGRPKFAGGSVVFNGTDQYATAPEGITDFGGLTIDMMIDRVAGGTLFDFGTGDDECFYLRIDASSGKAILGARHAGKSFSISSSHSIPAGKPTRLRIEMNSSTAAIHIDGKPAVTGKFAFSPRDVFIGDRAEGNFIAASRAQKDFYKGKIDHFRVYRQVHKDFDALGAIPFPLTQAPDWSPEDQKKADDWDARKKAKEAELKAGEYGKMLGQIKKLNSQKSELYRAKSKELQNLETLAREASKAKSNLDRKIRDKVNDRLKTVKDEQQKKDLRKQIETQNRATKQYAAAVAKRQAAEQALRVGRENNRKRIEREMSKELTRIATDIAKLQSDSKAMRENALKDAGLSGRNPHPGQRQAEQQAKYKFFTYHATADWSGVVHDDRRQPEHLAPPKMRAWLKRVRGY